MRLFRLLRGAVPALAILFAVSGFTSFESLFAPKAELWERWTAHDSSSTETIDFGEWDRLLMTYVRASDSGVNHFAYGEVTPDDSAALDGFLARLAGLPVSRSPPPASARAAAQGRGSEAQ